MDAIVVVLSLILIGLALFIILYPLWERTQAETFLEIDATGQTLEELQARYAASLAAIKDLMFDYEMGKVSTEDYEALLNRAKIEAARLRQQIDRLSASTERIAANPTLDIEIEESIARLRHKQAASPELLAAVEAEIEALKDLQPELLASATCPGCGRAIRPDDVFCSGCGRALTPEDTSPLAESCPHCGYAYQPGDAFCAHCGAVLKASVEVPDYEDSKR